MAKPYFGLFRTTVWKDSGMVEVETIMKTEVITITGETPIYEAIETMVANNLTGLPVVDDDMRLIGIITEKDVLTLLYNFEDKPGTVEDYMTEQVVSFDRHESLDDIAESFKHNHFRRVPIVTDGKLVGIISRRDIIGYISKMRKKDAAAV